MKNIKWIRYLRNLLLAAIGANVIFLLYRIFNGNFEVGYYQNVERLVELVILAVPVSILHRLSLIQLLLVLIVAPFLHYTLPQHDIVRITNTYNKQTVIGSNWLFYSSGDSGANTTTTTDTIRDIRYIDAVFPDGESVMVYRNEDTGWIWPPYFKYDSSTLQAEATNLKSDKTAPEWVSVTHYGWRLPIFSIFPNAVAVNPVAGPDVSITPWVNIIVLTLLAFGLFMLRRMWMQFRERAIDPAVASAGEAWDSVDATADAARDKAKGVFGRFTAWLGTWGGKGR